MKNPKCQYIHFLEEKVLAGTSKANLLCVLQGEERLTLPCSAVPPERWHKGSRELVAPAWSCGSGVGVKPGCPHPGSPKGNRDLCLGGGMSEGWDNLAPAPVPVGMAKHELEWGRCWGCIQWYIQAVHHLLGPSRDGFFSCVLSLTAFSSAI